MIHTRPTSRPSQEQTLPFQPPHTYRFLKVRDHHRQHHRQQQQEGHQPWQVYSGAENPPWVSFAEYPRAVGAPVDHAQQKGQPPVEGVELMCGLEADDQGEPRVVQEVSRCTALRQNAQGEG